MSVLKSFLVCVAVLAAFMMVTGLFLPSAWHVDRSILIEASPETIHRYVATPALWAEWCPWPGDGASPAVGFAGPASGVGAALLWDGEESGGGSLTITHSDPRRGVAYDLRTESPSLEAVGSLALSPEAGGTRVTWSSSGDVGGNPFRRFLTLCYGGLMGPRFERGLADLKRRVESDAAARVPLSL